MVDDDDKAEETKSVGGCPRKESNAATVSARILRAILRFLVFISLFGTVSPLERIFLRGRISITRGRLEAALISFIKEQIRKYSVGN